MDPVSQVLAQQQSGSANGQGFGQFFVAGQQHAQDKQRLNLANRAESRMQARQNALLPYEQSVMAGQVIAMGQQAEFNRQKQLTMLQQNNAMPEILALESHFMQSQQGYKDPDGLAAYEQLRNRFPHAFAEGGPGYNLRMRVQMPTVLDAEMQRLQQANDKLAKSGRPDLFVQKFDTQGQPVLGERTPRLAPGERATLAKRQGLEPSGLDATGQVDYARPREPQTSNVIRTLPDGTTEVVLGATQGDLTNQQRGAAKLQHDKLTDTASRLGELAALSEDLFGPKAAVGNFIVDETLSNFNPSLAKGQRIQGRSKAALTREGIVQALGAGQGQLSNKDIDRLLEPFPKSGLKEVINESPVDARNKLLSIQKELARTAFETSKSRGVEPESRLLRMVDPFVLRKELSNGRITQDQFIDAINNNAHIDEVKRFLDSK